MRHVSRACMQAINLNEIKLQAKKCNSQYLLFITKSSQQDHNVFNDENATSIAKFTSKKVWATKPHLLHSFSIQDYSR